MVSHEGIVKVMTPGKIMDLPSIRTPSHTRLKAPDHGNVRALLVEKAETVQVLFTLGGEGLKAQRKVHG